MPKRSERFSATVRRLTAGVRYAVRVVGPWLHLAPVGFAAAAVLSLFFHNIGELAISRLTAPLVAVVAGSYIIAWISYALFRDVRKGDIFASVAMALFFTFGEASRHAGLLRLPVGGADAGKYLVFVVWVAALAGSYLLLTRPRRRLDTLMRALTVAGVAMVIMPAWGIIRYQQARNRQPKAVSPLILPQLTTATAYKPDVYYIVPDSYPSAGNLSKYFSYDDSAFISYLTDKGFYVAADSTSNYPTTLLSLASTLNMEYLDYLSVHHPSADVSFATDLIQNSNALKLFRSQGYKFYQMGSWWWSTQRNPTADENFTIQKDKRLGLGEFTYDLLNSTMLSPFLERVLPSQVIGESEDDKRAIVEYQFRTLPEVASLTGPKFVFVHIISPHPPYVFDSNCNHTSYAQNWQLPEEKRYARQVNCIDAKLEGAIDAILGQSPQPPVIILQSDEGIKFVADRIVPPESWQDASVSQLKEKFPIMAAYYLPGVDTGSLYPSMTPVNAFRTVFNLYFSAGLPLLPDRNFIYLDNTHLYDFKEVTGLLPAKNIP